MCNVKEDIGVKIVTSVLVLYIKYPLQYHSNLLKLIYSRFLTSIIAASVFLQ